MAVPIAPRTAGGDWTAAITDPAELRSAFSASPQNRWRPVALWWWSGEPLDEQRLLWQLETLHTMGFGGVAPISFAPFGPAGGSTGDQPPLGTAERTALYRTVLLRCRELGLGVVVPSPAQVGGLREIDRLLRTSPQFRAEIVDAQGRVLPYGFDLGNPDAVDALLAPETVAGRIDAAIADLYGDPVVAMFEDELWVFARWAPGFDAEFRAAKGFPPRPDVFAATDDPRAPAMRWQISDVARMRAERAYTARMRRWREQRGLLAAYDQMSRAGLPVLGSLAYIDHMRTMAWANAPGSDQMGDIRFHLSVADLTGAPRVCLEGFHSQGQGFTLAHQAEQLFELAREGASLFLAHGVYYATRGMWWEWASPDMAWRQPYARHYPAFAAMAGRLMTVAAAGRHHPEVGVLQPLSTVWADTVGHLEWGPDARRAQQCYAELMGMHGSQAWNQPGAWAQPSLLHDAGYDRIAVNEDWLDRVPELPLILPACRCLPVAVVDALIRRAESGVPVVAVAPLPDVSAEHGRDDDEFLRRVAELRHVATVVDTPVGAVAALPPPRLRGEPRAQWRRAGDLDLLLATGAGELRVHGVGARAAEQWDVRDGTVRPLDSRLDGDDLVLSLHGSFTVVALPPGRPRRVAEAECEVTELPDEWECEYLPWGENRWGDLHLPANQGTPPVQRRTFAWREGDDPEWRLAPVVPEDCEHPAPALAMEERMAGDPGRVPPAQRRLRDGWHEVVSTYGPRALVDGAPVEYSERYGIEDSCLETMFGVRGRVEPWKALLPEGGGRVVSYAKVAASCDSNLVVEGGGVLTVWLDGKCLAGPVEGGVLCLPVFVRAGWHEVAIELQPRRPAPQANRGYRALPPPRLSWCFTEPYARDAMSIWGGRMIHPDYRGAAGARRFRRRITLSEPATVTEWTASSGTVALDVPETLPAGEHTIEAWCGEAVTTPSFLCRLRLDFESGARLDLVSDPLWETAAPGGEWEGAFELSTGAPLSGWDLPPAEATAQRRHPLRDVAWLEGAEVLRGQVEHRWSDSPSPPPPSWFAFLAPPGARSMTLPIDGEVRAWLDGEEVALDGEVLRLREGARVAMRVQAPAGGRGAACFREHPVLELGPGRIRTGVSWHRQGLDCFAGVILHRATVHVEHGGRALLDLGEVRGSVGVRVNGEDCGVVFCAPWRVDVPLRAGDNVFELEVAGTLGPLVGRGVPTVYGPEDQRVCGLLARPRLLRVV
jgi:hypothetical protein